VKVSVGLGWNKKYVVTLTQGRQSFTIDYEGTLEEARWMARMFRIALKRHDKSMRDKK
jgi:hypothetical protein